MCDRSEAWLAVLQLPVPQDLYHKVLLRLHSSVIPNMTSPNMLADFLTFSLNQGARRCVSVWVWRVSVWSVWMWLFVLSVEC